jgi:hypothetical protein
MFLDTLERECQRVKLKGSADVGNFGVQERTNIDFKTVDWIKVN